MISFIEEFLDEMIEKHNIYVKFGDNISISYIGIKNDTAQGKRAEFILRRYINE